MNAASVNAREYSCGSAESATEIDDRIVRICLHQFCKRKSPIGDQ